MNLKRRALAAVLAAAFILASALPAMAAPYAKEHHIELEQVGELASDGIRLSYDAFIGAAGDDSAFVYDVNGKKVTEDEIVGIKYLEDGLYTLSKAGATDVNSCALMNADGKILIPFEHAIYAWPKNINNGSYKQTRYITVFTGTEETKDKEEALFFTTDSFVAINPGEDDIMYKGYAEIFDLQKEQFVPGIKLEQVDKYDTVNVVGNSLLIENEDGSYTMYDENGKKLKDLNSTTKTNGLAAVERSQSGSGYSVFDDQGKEISSGAGSANVFESASGYISVYEDGKYNVLDVFGKSVVKAPIDGTVYGEDHDVFRTDGGKGYRLIDGATGAVLADAEKNISNEGYGLYSYETGDKICALVTPAGLISEDLKQVDYSGILADGDDLIAYNDGSAFLKYDEEARYNNYNGVLCVEPADGGDPALYDLFTGKLLLDDGFVSARTAGDRLVLEYRNSSTPIFKTFEINVKDGK